MPITTTPLSPHIGLEVHGLDLERDFDEETLQALRDAWARGGVLLFRGCRSAEAHLRLSRGFGELESSATPHLCTNWLTTSWTTATPTSTSGTRTTCSSGTLARDPQRRGVPLDVPRRAQRTTLVGDYGHGRLLDPTSAG
jgi:alpha-ketoglutarate-dependent taurine dioxygenase